ncbi:hypothetical protein DFH09DRAFT_1114588 [Mycena vulgaris]|nr:hypothetical protein DFH09DRAFT_1114588 [Mycena vulgaris]
MASSSHSEPLPAPGECHAHDVDTGDECDCIEYTELGTSGLCSTCLHKRKHHLSRPPSDQPTKNVQNILTGMLKNTRSGSSSSSTLEKIKKSRPQLAVAGSSNSRCSQANQEANSGMRPTKGKKGKSKAKDKDASNLYRVQSITILPYGLSFLISSAVKRNDQAGVLQLPEEHQKIPDKRAVQTAVLHGLAAIGDENGIELDRTWSHEQLNDFFSDLLPKPFTYLLQQSNGVPSYHLGVISSKRLQVVPALFPTGFDADYNKGSNTTGFRNNRLWILSREPIPRNILEEWIDPVARQFRIANSPNNAEDDSDSEEAIDSPKPARRRRAKRHSTDNGNHEEDEEPPKKKRKNASGKARAYDLPEILNDNVAHEIMDSDGSDFIDLTADDIPRSPRHHSTPPLFLSATPPPPPAKSPVNPTLSPEFKVDKSLGNPYAANQTYDF